MCDQELVLGVDAGTSSIKTGIFTLDGQLLALETAAYRLSTPEPGAMEQDANDWWAAMVVTIRRALARAEGRGRPIGIAVGGQAPTFVAADAELRPTHAAITWLDQRPGAEAERMYARLGQPVPVYGSWAALAAWFTCSRPEALSRTRWYFGCPDYLAARLAQTPSSYLSVSDAEIQAGSLDAQRLPPTHQPGQPIGYVQADGAAETGLPVGTPVLAGFVDGVLGVLGSGARLPGDATMNGGTSGTYSTLCEPPLGYPLLGLRILGGGAVNTSGKALDWFVHQIAPTGADLGALLEEVAAVPPGADGLLFLPHLAGERSPQRDPLARGAWVGLTLSHDRRHLLRAVLEGVAFSFRSLQDSCKSQGGEVRDVRSVGGQARSALWNQIKADVLCRPVLTPEVIEAPVAGTAILAARGVGAFATDDEAVANMVRIARSWEPDPQRAARYSELFEVYAGLYTALREANWRLH